MRGSFAFFVLKESVSFKTKDASRGCVLAREEDVASNRVRRKSPQAESLCYCFFCLFMIEL